MSEARCVPTTTASYHVASPSRSSGTCTRNTRFAICVSFRERSFFPAPSGAPGTKSFTTWKLVTTKPPSANAVHTTPVPRGVYPPLVPFGSYTASDTTERDAASNTRVAFASSTSARAGSVCGESARDPSDAPSAPSARRRRPRHRESASGASSFARSSSSSGFEPHVIRGGPAVPASRFAHDRVVTLR
jgi:hypothetical protein